MATDCQTKLTGEGQEEQAKLFIIKNLGWDLLVGLDLGRKFKLVIFLEHLKVLTAPLLISRVKVFLTVFKLRGGQYGYNGQVINFNQDVNELATRLPHTLASLSNVLFVRRETDDLSAFSEFQVRKRKVWQALNFLIRNHSGYRDVVTVNTNVLDDLPEDGSVANRLTQLDDSVNNDQAIGTINRNNEGDVERRQHEDNIDLIDHTAAPQLHIPNIREEVNRQLNIVQSEQNDAANVVPFPAINPHPINEFTTPGYVANAFPWLFPIGNFLAF